MGSIVFTKFIIIQRSLEFTLKRYSSGYGHKGIEYLKNPRLNKDIAFTLEERKSLRIQGLLPPAIKTQKEQLNLYKLHLDRCKDNLSKSIFMYDLKTRNEKLFYKLINKNIAELLPIVYKPTIAGICQKYGLIINQPKGLFISIYDRGHIPEVLKNWEEKDVRVVIATDGEDLPGLGDMGCHSMIFPVAKSVLYTAIAGIKPQQCLPITLDVGTNNDELLKDPLYLGLKHRRTMGPTYIEFIDEFIDSIINRYGSKTIIQFEGLNRQNSIEFLKKYRKKCCYFDDDLQCKGAVILAGLIASEAILNKPIKEYKVLFLGVDESSFSIANTLVNYLQNIGLSTVEAINKMWMFDEHGLLARTRTEGKLNGDKLTYAKDFEPSLNPAEIIKQIQPNVLISIDKFFNPDVLFKMSEVNQRPLIFALNDLVNLDDIHNHTKGSAIVSTTSFIRPENSKNSPGQVNSCLIYPGVVLGALAAGIKKIPDEIFTTAAKCIAEKVTYEDLSVGNIFPTLNKVKRISIDLATKICQYSYKKGLANFYPEPDNKKAYVETQLYNYQYENVNVKESTKCKIKKEKNIPSEVKNEKFNIKSIKIVNTIGNVEEIKTNFDEVKIIERNPPESYKPKPEPTS